MGMNLEVRSRWAPPWLEQKWKMWDSSLYNHLSLAQSNLISWFVSSLLVLSLTVGWWVALHWNPRPEGAGPISRPRSTVDRRRYNVWWSWNFTAVLKDMSQWGRTLTTIIRQFVLTVSISWDVSALVCLMRGHLSACTVPAVVVLPLRAARPPEMWQLVWVWGIWAANRDNREVGP